MNSQGVKNSKIQEAMAARTEHPDYDSLPESIKILHSPKSFVWLGSERLMVIDRETQPDMDVTE